MLRKSASVARGRSSTAVGVVGTITSVIRPPENRKPYHERPCGGLGETARVGGNRPPGFIRGIQQPCAKLAHCGSWPWAADARGPGRMRGLVIRHAKHSITTSIQLLGLGVGHTQNNVTFNCHDKDT